MADTKQITPEVTWAQRSSTTEPEKNHIFLTISVPDVSPKEIKIDIQPEYLDFTGFSQTKKTNYHVKLEFFDQIDPKECQVNHTARDIEFVLRKKELKEEYWPRLLKDKAKVHFLKTNFDKWVDEDEQNETEDGDMDYMNRMGGMGGAGGMPGMEGLGGMGGMPGMEGLGGMGGMAGLGGMGGEGGFGGIASSKLGAGGAGMPDFGDAGDDDDGEDGEEGLEEDAAQTDAGGEAVAAKATPAATSSSSGAKIEEVE